MSDAESSRILSIDKRIVSSFIRITAAKPKS